MVKGNTQEIPASPLVSSSSSSLIEYKDFYKLDPSRIHEEISIPPAQRKGPRGGVIDPFPVRLYKMLESVERDGLADVISWQWHGRCFLIHDKDRFVQLVLPRYGIESLNSVHRRTHRQPSLTSCPSFCLDTFARRDWIRSPAN